MKKGIIAVLLAALVVSLLVIGNGLNPSDITVESGDWLDGWGYRKAHNITGSTAGSQTNFPVALSVHYDNGVDNAGEVYLSGKCRTDFGDIRFTDLTGANPLDYWIQQKTDGAQALFWVEIGCIPANPNSATIYIYYGNANTSTTSNKDWTFDLTSDFEDGTKQGWTISWSSYVTEDGTSTASYEGNRSRKAGRLYGASDAAGIGDFYDCFTKAVYVTNASYRLESACRFELQDVYRIPIGIRLLANGLSAGEMSSPGTGWCHPIGNFTVGTSGFITLTVEFHLYVTSNLFTGAESYFIDSVFLRKWCNPEPIHGSWASEVSEDYTSPTIYEVEWTPTAPFPFVPSSVPRKGEPIHTVANVSEEAGGSGLDYVMLSYRVDSNPWSNTTMMFNLTSQLWEATIPGQLGNTTVEFHIIAYDNAKNAATSSTHSYDVRALPTADINGDGIVNMLDLYIAAIHFSETEL